MKIFIFFTFFLIISSHYWEKQEFNNIIILPKDYQIYEISKDSREIKIHVKCLKCQFYLIRHSSIENYKNRMPFLPLIDSGPIINEYSKYFGDQNQLQDGLHLIIQNNNHELSEISIILESYLPNNTWVTKYFKMGIIGAFGSIVFCLVITLISFSILLCIIFGMLYKGKDKELNKIIDKIWNKKYL